MTDPEPRVPAVGGMRDVPAPDPFARDYLLLALRLDQRIPGLVDGYYGPATLKAAVDIEQLRPPHALRDDVAALRGRLDAEIAGAARRRWLDAQLIAFDAHARALTGDPLPYLDHVVACFDWRPRRRPDALFAQAAAELDELLPLRSAADVASFAQTVSTGATLNGDRTIADRLAAWDAALAIPPERLPGVVAWLVAHFRARARALFGVPDGEDLDVRFVRKQPWSGYNWYDGGLRSRVDLNLDLPVRAGSLLHVIAHETYFGHHLEHAWKEADRVEENRELEASLLAINAPECLISEGLADLGYIFAAPPDQEAELLATTIELAGLPISQDPQRLRDVAERQVAIGRAQATLREAAVNAALMRHVDGAAHDEARAYLTEIALFTEEQAEKRLEFIEHPLWRTYVYVYSEGEALLRRWLDLAPPVSRAERFARLLHEPLTPSGVADEIAAATASGAAVAPAPADAGAGYAPGD